MDTRNKCGETTGLCHRGGLGHDVSAGNASYICATPKGGDQPRHDLDTIRLIDFLFRTENLACHDGLNQN